MEAAHLPLVIPGFELQVGPLMVFFFIALMYVFGLPKWEFCLIIASKSLFGIFCTQCYYYYITYAEDRLTLRFLVLAIWYVSSKRSRV
jgi:hypothetical protein